MRWAVGLDVGGTKIAGALVGETGEVRGSKCSFITDKGQSSIDAVLEMAENLLAFARAERCQVDGLGVAVPGAVEPGTGIVIRAPNLDWENLPLKQRLEAALGIPVEVELDVRAAALGAMLSDIARGVRDFAYVTIGTGIGAGIVIDGKLHRGFHSCSGEIGHCVLVENGPQCGCGQRGCFEALAAGSAIADRAGRLVKESSIPSTMSAHADTNGRINPKDIFEAADSGDQLACEVIRATAQYLGRGLSLLINILNPQMIIIGGGVAKGGEGLLSLVRQYTAEYTIHQPAKQTEIVLSPDLDHLPIVGAANLIFKRQ